MTPEEALVHFLSGALQKRWRARYVSLVQTQRGKSKFLADLWHVFEHRLDFAKAVCALPEDAWSASAFSFSETVGFGREEESLKTAFDKVGDGSLIVDVNGRYGIYQPEDAVDRIKYFRV